MTMSAVTLTALDPAEQRARWGAAVDPGLVIVPTLLLRHQAKLGLTPVQVLVVLNIVAEWHEQDDWPAPRPSVIAARMSTSTRTVERSIAELERIGLVKRLPGEKCRA